MPRDLFWGLNPPWTIPSVPEPMFWQGRPRPPVRGHFLRDWARTRLRLGAVLLGIGFFSVFVVQMDLLYQVVLGAPIFEEMLKFGLALILVAWAPDPHGRGGLWAVTMPLRILAATVVGGGFGVLEHYVTYRDEPASIYIGRVAFHTLSTVASMVTFTILEPVLDVRARWLSTAIPTFLHYVNNAGGLVFGVIATASGLSDQALLVVPILAIVGLLVVTVGLGWLAEPVRRLALEQVEARLAAPGSVFGRSGAPRAGGTPTTAR